MNPFYCYICKKPNPSQNMIGDGFFPVCYQCQINMKYKDSPIRKITLDRKREMSKKHYEKIRSDK